MFRADLIPFTIQLHEERQLALVALQSLTPQPPSTSLCSIPTHLTDLKPPTTRLRPHLSLLVHLCQLIVILSPPSCQRRGGLAMIGQLIDGQCEDDQPLRLQAPLSSLPVDRWRPRWHLRRRIPLSRFILSYSTFLAAVGTEEGNDRPAEMSS